jgi:hypothetical protein
MCLCPSYYRKSFYKPRVMICRHDLMILRRWGICMLSLVVCHARLEVIDRFARTSLPSFAVDGLFSAHLVVTNCRSYRMQPQLSAICSRLCQPTLFLLVCQNPSIPSQPSDETNSATALYSIRIFLAFARLFAAWRWDRYPSSPLFPQISRYSSAAIIRLDCDSTHRGFDERNSTKSHEPWLLSLTLQLAAQQSRPLGTGALRKIQRLTLWNHGEKDLCSAHY